MAIGCQLPQSGHFLAGGAFCLRLDKEGTQQPLAENKTLVKLDRIGLTRRDVKTSVWCINIPASSSEARLHFVNLQNKRSTLQMKKISKSFTFHAICAFRDCSH